MDPFRFVTLSRSLNRVHSRRRALVTILGAPLGLSAGNTTRAKKKGQGKKKHRKSNRTTPAPPAPSASLPPSPPASPPSAPNRVYRAFLRRRLLHGSSRARGLRDPLWHSARPGLPLPAARSRRLWASVSSRRNVRGVVRESDRRAHCESMPGGRMSAVITACRAGECPDAALTPRDPSWMSSTTPAPRFALVGF